MKPTELAAGISTWNEDLRLARRRSEQVADRAAHEPPLRERRRQKELDELQTTQEAESQARLAEAETARLALEQQQRQEATALGRQLAEATRGVERRREEALGRLDGSDARPESTAAAGMTKRLLAFEQGLEDLKRRLDQQRKPLAGVERQLGTPESKAQPETLRGSAEEQLAILGGRCEAWSADLASLREELVRRWLTPWRKRLILVLIIGGHAGAIALSLWLELELRLALGLALSCLLSLGIRLGLAALRRRQLRERFTACFHEYRLLDFLLGHVGDLGRKELDVQRLLGKHAKDLQAHSQRRREAEAGIEERHQAALAEVQQRHHLEEATLRRLHEQDRAALAQEQQQRSAALAITQQAAQAALLAVHEAEEGRWAAEIAAQRHAASQAIADCLASGRERLAALALQAAPAPYHMLPLGELRGQLHTVCPDSLRLGDDTTLALPVRIEVPHFSQLWLRSESEAGREQALRMLQGAALELLQRLPPGRLRLTIFDPIGLGQGFADFLPLIDLDERILGPKIWTQAQELEDRLAYLIDHTEQVIQKHLQRKHPDVSHYNAEAGELAEPYHLLILLDAPQGVRDLASERLRSLLTCGARCGVLIWLHQHRRELFPADMLKGWALREDQGRLRVADESLGDWSLHSQRPDEATLSAAIQQIGTSASQAARVAIGMHTGMPTAEAMWSADSRDGLHIPIGRCGAERMQHLDLGPGMAQHVLLGGRTGSGKSTLLHVIITNASCWYGPDQLQLSLIDFKKGVEFRAYAENRLPQARVIAIESDREFALSVLEDIDRELDRRGALFRQHGVQNIAQFRNGCSEALPRQLLVIDEFHEFFAEDDGLSRSAALLLDRLVRQGRAFGIHAVLGSQSLAGCYALGKSTLGQIAVRVALQCNEADSYMLLSEDNPAARYLERPGEGIYNDRSGLPDGNSPFQVFWLDDADRDRYLADIRQRDGARSPGPVVFEGNAPARLADGAQHLPPAGAASWTCLLGQPNALAGPTAVDLTAGASPHLLIVGQHREAACGIAGTALISLLRQHGSNLQIDVFDHSGDRRFDELLTLIQQRYAPQLRRLEPAALDAWAAGLSDDHGQPRVSLLLGIDSVPKLVEPAEDPFGLNAGGSSGPGSAYTAALRNEAAGAGHIIAWYAAASSLQRCLQRKTRQALSRRVLFQMSAVDSNEMIDDGTASRLGLYHALLAEADSGRREKFRPFALPEADELPTLLAP
jgi:hypothetical protein